MDTNESILFSQMGLHPSLIKLLEEKGFTIPTPVQAQAIPLALSGRDILGSAQTGTGKTLAFSIPLMNTLLQTDSGAALVLTPTRELAQQVVKAIGQVLGHNSSVKTALLIGGEPIFKQLKQLRGRPRIIVGTPGRVIDHLERGTLKTKFIKFLVLDETDRMLDMGFSVQLDEIIKQIPEERQTLMFSATIPKSIERLTEKYLTNPERIAIGHDSRPAENITQEVIKVSRTEKYAKLVSELDKREGSVIIFVKTRLGADRLADTHGLVFFDHRRSQVLAEGLPIVFSTHARNIARISDDVSVTLRTILPFRRRSEHRLLILVLENAEIGYGLLLESLGGLHNTVFGRIASTGFDRLPPGSK